MRVLVADDDVELLYSVTEVFERWGADVVGAHNGAELIDRLAHEGPFSLIVTDIAMPWMSGFHVMRSARRAGVATPVILMTGLQDERLLRGVRALGGEVILLNKPFSLRELEAAVMQLLPPPRASEARR